jgi:hypothetical protein
VPKRLAVSPHHRPATINEMENQTMSGADDARLIAELARVETEGARIEGETALHRAAIAEAVALIDASEHCTLPERIIEGRSLVARHAVALHRAGFPAAALRALHDVAA